MTERKIMDPINNDKEKKDTERSLRLGEGSSICLNKRGNKFYFILIQ